MAREGCACAAKGGVGLEELEKVMAPYFKS
jgi:hypothetical protein